ncbi:ATP-binding protein [Micromonospora endolithica]|uniref:XRE family transcriptional regulator n=1 Tax=Micromonospora endolithica TaxID=230091 RepID=A0A3A9ZDN2_9ACTN|nr:helix-turn-helix domain-containing protein [Micromonospora endolithica]RKN46388.1 XRE family transcriptional regulator [Micromonospora endolithica]TWJ24872.1 putative ATPase [Micromonospora endolithica]
MTPDLDRSRSPGTRTGLSELLRGHRLAAGLTQAELATRAGVGVRTVRDLERGRSARPQRTTVELLAGALDLAGEDRSAFLAAARGPVPAPRDGSGPAAAVDTDPAAGATSALPPPVTLIGRERDVAELVGTLLTDPVPRLMSLVGLTGVGKTALALTVAHEVAGGYPGGVAGVLIGEGSDAADVLTAALTVFGVARLPELATRLAGRPALLMMDAVERAPNAAADAVRGLTAAAPSLRVLVTGRHPVGLPGERVRPVAPLDVPPPGGEGGAPSLADYPAVALFTARLAQVRPEPPTPDELPALAALVRRLGGLPLAIELMAARARILDLNELLDRYGDRVLDLATSSGAAGRPGWDPADPAGTRDGRVAAAETLRDAVATSYRLLAPDERAALRRLAAFGNRWSVEMTEEMLADGGDSDGTVVVDPVPLLDRFLELGLLSVRGVGPFRFRLLDAVRDFAAEQAAGAGEWTAIRRRHAEVLARLVARTAPDLVGVHLPAAVYRLDQVSGDISWALAHAAVDDPGTALRLAAGLVRWWRFRGRDVAGRQWLCRLLADPRTADADPVLRAWASLGVARLAAEHGAGPEEVPTVRMALAAFRTAGDVAGELAARTVLGELLVGAGGHDEAREHAEAVLALAARHGRTRDMAVAQGNLSWHEIRAGDVPAARRRLAAVDRLATQCADRRLRLLAQADLVELSRLEGRYADAADQGRRVLRALDGLGDPGHRRRVLGAVGLALAQAGRAAEAAEVLAELRPPIASVPLAPAVVVAPRVRFDDLDAVSGAFPDARPEDAVCALIEGYLALHRGDRDLAAEWFTAVAELGSGGPDRREVVEALVGLAASTGDPEVLDRLDAASRDGGVRLLPREEELLYALDAARRSGRRGGPGAARAK